MSTDTSQSPSLARGNAAAIAVSTSNIRVWPPAAIVAAYWLFNVISSQFPRTISAQFFGSVLSVGGLFLLFTIWLFANRGLRWTDKFTTFGAMVVGSIAVTMLCDPSIGVFGVVFVALPVGISCWTLAMLLGAKRWTFFPRWGMLAVLVPIWLCFAMVRRDKMDGDLQAGTHWRWTPNAEQLLIAQRAKAGGQPKKPLVESAPLTLQAGDWPGFRGPNRDGELVHASIAADWSGAPPKLLWKRKIGPAWSSVAVVGDRLFTQEQRDKSEAVVCLDVKTGDEIWIHEDKARYWDSQAGAGARETPTFANGKIYSLGATGILNCCDAATGKLIWTQNALAAATNKTDPPMWGVASSPLVVDGIVIIYIAGATDKGLLAYHADTGKPAWTAATGKTSYSSPQLVSIDGQSQILFFGDLGVTAVRSDDGAALWQFDMPNAHAWRAIQPRHLGDGRILFGAEDFGLVLVDVHHDGDKWTAAKRWVSASMKPAYNDLVVADDHAYGFDGGILCCVDLKNGQRSWKGGHFGHGQVLLIADQHLLLVQAETGEVAVVAAQPRKYEERGRFQAIEGVTWNHPVIAHGRLFVRNDQEIACFDVEPTTAATPQKSL